MSAPSATRIDAELPGVANAGVMGGNPASDDRRAAMQGSSECNSGLKGDGDQITASHLHIAHISRGA